MKGKKQLNKEKEEEFYRNNKIKKYPKEKLKEKKKLEKI